MRHLIVMPLLLVAVATVQAQEAERFSLSGSKATIYNLAGEVRVERGSGSNVVVELTRGGPDADQLSVRTGDVDGWSALRVLYPDDQIVYPRLGRMSRTQFDIGSDGTFGGSALRATLTADGYETRAFSLGRSRDRITVTGRGSGLEAWADMRVLVPAGQTVAIHLGVGKVNVSNVDGDVRVDARSGSVTATNVKGGLLIDTGSGSVNASGVDGHAWIDTGSGSVDLSDHRNGRVRIDTGSGGIDVTNADATDVHLDTGSGSIELSSVRSRAVRAGTGSGGIRAERITARDVNFDTGSGSIVVRMLSDVDNMKLDTGSGGVTLYVPSSLGAEIEVDTGSGGIDTEVALQNATKRRSHLRGRIGDGNGRIVIDTGSGSVSIRSN